GVVVGRGVDRERRVAQALHERGADELARALEGDVLVVAALRRLGRGGEDGRPEFFEDRVALAHARGERDAADRAVAGVILRARAGDVAARDALDLHDAAAPADGDAPAELLALARREARHVVDVGREQV